MVEAIEYLRRDNLRFYGEEMLYEKFSVWKPRPHQAPDEISGVFLGIERVSGRYGEFSSIMIGAGRGSPRWSGNPLWCVAGDYLMALLSEAIRDGFSIGDQCRIVFTGQHLNESGHSPRHFEFYPLTMRLAEG